VACNGAYACVARRPRVPVAAAAGLSGALFVHILAWRLVEAHPYPLRAYGPHATWINGLYILTAYALLACAAYWVGTTWHGSAYVRGHGNPSAGLAATIAGHVFLGVGVAANLRSLVALDAWRVALLALPVAAALTAASLRRRGLLHARRVEAGARARIAHTTRTTPDREPPRPPPFVEHVHAPGVSFRDVIGMEDAKRDLAESIRLIQDPESARRHGIDPVRGILLDGPPGTGKTYFARAAAGEYRLHFLNVRTAQLVHEHVGRTEKNIQELFAYARSQAPCILFIDEIDTIGAKRSAAQNAWERTQVNALLQEMDGIHRHADAPVVLAATNDRDALDPALLRPGRFDRHVHVGLPDAATRARLLRYHLGGRAIEPDVDLRALATRLDGWTPKQVEALVKEAFRVVYREDSSVPPRPLQWKDFRHATRRVSLKPNA